MGRIMIVDDASFMRAVQKKIVLQSEHEIIAEAANGDEAINQYQNSKPDHVLMDIVMPPTPLTKDGIEALKQIVQTDPAAQIVMCSSTGNKPSSLKRLSHRKKISSLKPFSLKK